MSLLLSDVDFSELENMGRNPTNFNFLDRKPTATIVHPITKIFQ